MADAAFVKCTSGQMLGTTVVLYAAITAMLFS